MKSHAQTVLNEARRWIGTPYHHEGKVLGAGVDCLMLIVCCYQAAHLLPDEQPIPPYPADIMFHRDDRRYLEGILAHCDEVENPAPGDIALWKFGRCYCHGAIVLEWPQVIHAYAPLKQVVEMRATDDSRLAQREVRFFTPRGQS